MAQRRSPGSRTSKPKAKSKAASRAKTKAKSKTKTRAGAKTAAKPARKAAAKAKPKRTAEPPKKPLPKAAKPNARRSTRAVEGRTAQGRRSPARAHFEQTTKPGVENRLQDIYEDGRQSADERFSPGNYEPGQVGEAKTPSRRRGNRDSETEALPDAGSRVATDGALEPGPRREEPEAE